ncbi:MAG TPA: hypothetical protein DIV86_07230 [Alphaproteobacteria bacterium]|nr:hypothetical protein [Alphaproteobacteria bacterium]
MTSSNKKELFTSIFSTIIGHNNIKNILLDFYLRDSIPSSIIFYGNEGIGKFKTADTFSKLISRKEEKENDELSLFQIEDSLNKYDISTQTYEDIKIIEPNANGIITSDNIKDIKNITNFSSSYSKYKIIIINKAENLNIQAANSILKILEEPSNNTLFILVCNDINKLYETIKSRCIKIRFNNLSFNDYKAILKENNIEADYDLFSKTSGSISKTIDILENKILESVDSFLDIIKRGDNNIGSLTKISEKFKDHKKKTNYILFLDILTNELLKKNNNRKIIELIEKLNYKNTDISDNIKSIRYKCL